MSEDRIKVTFFSPSDNPGSFVVATLGLRINSMDLYLSKVKLVRKKDGTFYVASPSESYNCPKTGEKKYANFWWFDSTAGFFQKETLKAIDTYCKAKGIPNPIYGDAK